MKKLLLLPLLALALMAGCRRTEPVPFATTHFDEDKLHFLGLDSEGDSLFMQTSLDLDWPVSGCIAPDAERELSRLCFGIDGADTPAQAAARWADTLRRWADTEFASAELSPLYYYSISTYCSRSGHIATFGIATEESSSMAAHGTYSYTPVTIDLRSGRVVHLHDLLDTTRLLPLLPQALRELDTNRDVLDCLFPEYRDSLPLPSSFDLDSARTHLTVNYGLYEVAPYSCGIQSIVLPLDWLAARLPLTPYAQGLLHP